MFTCVRIKDVEYYSKVREEDKSSRASYYAGQEAEGGGAGKWHMFGKGLCGIADGSSVDFNDLESLAAGSDPRNGKPLLKSTRTERTSGYDLQFAPPKSFSVLMACADGELRTKLEAAGERSVRRALELVQAEGLLECRRGKGGMKREAAAGWLAAVFCHRLSRAGDPQTHWHCVVPNAALRLDGSTGGLDNRAVLGFARAVGAAFNSQLANELKDEFGLRVRQSEDGKAFELVGFDGEQGQKICGQFSKRRKDVVSALAVHGADTGTSRQAARFAALNTRGRKDALPTMLLAEGHVGDAINLYDTRGHVRWHGDRGDAVAALAAEWAADAKERPAGGRLALAATHAEVRELNAAIRAVERASGRLHGTDVSAFAVPKAGRGRKLPEAVPISLAQGDRVIFGESVRVSNRDIRNSDMATVRKIERKADGEIILEVVLDKDRDVLGDNAPTIVGTWSEFAGHRRRGEPKVPRLSLAFAISLHSSQGHTQPGKIYVLSASAAMGRESLYVAMTRHKDDVVLHVDAGRIAAELGRDADDAAIKKAAIAGWSRTERRLNAADFLENGAKPMVREQSRTPVQQRHHAAEAMAEMEM